MNIFYLDKDPKICATMHCDKHVVKMIIESNQILCSVILKNSGINSKKEYLKNKAQRILEILNGDSL